MSNYNNYPCKLASNYGISLIECMLASALGIFLLFGLLEIYGSIKNTYRLQQSLARMQENGRYAIYFLNQNIRMAGYNGCDEKVHGYSSKQVPDFLRNSRIVVDSDIIVIDRCNKQSRKEIAYFVAKTSQKNALGFPIYGLYEKILVDGKDNQPAQEVVTHIENMQINYGISVDGKNISSYQKSPKNWHDVRSVEISLQLNSDDKILHKEWQTYITLREYSKPL